MRKFFVGSLFAVITVLGSIAVQSTFAPIMVKADDTAIDNSTSGTLRNLGSCIYCTSGKAYKVANDGGGRCGCWSCC